MTRSTTVCSRTRWSALAFVLALALTSSGACDGCDACGDGPPASLRVEGPHPHVRCLAAEPPGDAEWTVGDATLDLSDGVLTLSGLTPPVRFAVFAGPAPGAIEAAALAEIGERHVELAIVLGSFGDDRESAGATFAALSALSIPVLLVPGGRDDAGVYAEALEQLDSGARTNLVDTAPIRRVVIGATELVPIAGAPHGRYARTPSACGFGERDLDARTEALEPPADGVARWLLSWAAPRGAGATAMAGVDAGDEMLERFSAEIGARGGLYAWPREAVVAPPRETVTNEIVRAIGGPATVSANGSRFTPGATFHTLDAAGFAPP